MQLSWSSWQARWPELPRGPRSLLPPVVAMSSYDLLRTHKPERRQASTPEQISVKTTVCSALQCFVRFTIDIFQKCFHYISLTYKCLIVSSKGTICYSSCGIAAIKRPLHSYAVAVKLARNCTNKVCGPCIIACEFYHDAAIKFDLNCKHGFVNTVQLYQQTAAVKQSVASTSSQ